MKQLNFIQGTKKQQSSLNYIGSKHKLLPFIEQAIHNTVPTLKGATIADLFAGTGAISKRFKGLAGKIIANDIEPYSYVINRNYIGNNTHFDYDRMIEDLNKVKGIRGIIHNNYCLGGGQGRLYFSDENGKKIDAIRQQIEHLKDTGAINADKYYFLLASLLESADKVANVASVYGAYLKKLKSTAQKPLVLKPAIFQVTKSKTKVHQMDANELIKNISGDILYLDPPYNHRQYGANYHLLNTIAIYDSFEPRGKTGLRNYEKSQYCKKNNAAVSFAQLISNSKFKYIFLSYNNEGIMSINQIKEIMSKYGKYSLLQTDYQRFKADCNRTQSANRTTEYLHVLTM